MPVQLDISALGARGDGLATHEGQRLHVPYTLPGERVLADISGERAELREILAPSPDRIAPLCPHFGTCGGCVVQHLAAERIAEWKRSRIALALSRAGLETLINPTLDAHGAGRRRVTLHVRLKDGVAQAGFMRAKSHDLIDLDLCPLLVPELAPAPDLARQIGHILRGLGKPLDVQVSVAQQGLDVDFRGAGALPEALKLKLIAFAAEHKLARLTQHGERLMEASPPSIALFRSERDAEQGGPASRCEGTGPNMAERSSVRVNRESLTAFLPPGSFLQATAEAEETLSRLALEALAGVKSVADLFCGLGPFALRLARHMKVMAYDADKGAIEALQRSIRANPGGKPIAAEARDLFRRPLFGPDLKPFDAVVLDPPRQGADAQTREIAKSKLARVVYISCDPESFARDAATLVKAGFRLKSVTPVDQFRFSSHVELVGVLVR